MHRELYEYRVEIDGGNALNLSKNPSPAMLMFFIGTTRRALVRACIVGPDVYFWDACLATHEDVQTYFGVPVLNDGFDVSEVEEDQHYRVAAQEAALPKLLASPAVRKAITDPRIVIAREDGSEHSLA